MNEIFFFQDKDIYCCKLIINKMNRIMLFIIVSLKIISLSLASNCTDLKPMENTKYSCIHTYLPNAVCCFHKIEDRRSKETTYSCVEKPTKESNTRRYEEINNKWEFLDCSLDSTNFCSSKTFGCDFGNEVTNAQCCLDIVQNICFTFPYHYKDPNYKCTALFFSIKYFMFSLILLLF